MTTAEYTARTNAAEAEVDRLVLCVAATRELIALMDKIVDEVAAGRLVQRFLRS
jgi:hypothetical protein